MADFDFPDDLVAAQRAFDAADAECAELSATLPSAVSVAAGEAEITEGQRAGMAAARARRDEALGLLNDHPWWVNVDRKHEAKMALRVKARG